MAISAQVYERMPPQKFMLLPLEIRQRISNLRVKEGKPQFNYGWGDYKAQRPLLGKMLENSVDDFAYMRRV